MGETWDLIDSPNHRRDTAKTNQSVLVSTINHFLSVDCLFSVFVTKCPLFTDGDAFTVWGKNTLTESVEFRKGTRSESNRIRRIGIRGGLTRFRSI